MRKCPLFRTALEMQSLEISLRALFKKQMSTSIDRLPHCEIIPTSPHFGNVLRSPSKFGRFIRGLGLQCSFSCIVGKPIAGLTVFSGQLGFLVAG